MTYAPPYSKLAAMSRDDLVSLYDQNTPHVVLGLDFIRQEIARRDAAQANDEMLSLTRKITWLTAVVTAATLVNVVIVIVALFFGQ